MILRTTGMVRLIVVIAVTVSLASLPGSLSTNFGLPTLRLAYANPAPGFCHLTPLGPSFECWYPAGPAMDTLQAPIFTDSTAEFTCFDSATPCVDLTDSPLPPTLFQPLDTNPGYYVTAPISEHSVYDFQFMLANNFWGVDMNFGNNPNGTLIRQGISHLIDKTSFVSSQSQCANICVALDNPVPPDNGGLPSPNPCRWDSAVSVSVNFTEVGTNCVVGSAGGTAYHLARATGVNFPWQPALGSPDFCAAAQHFIAAGLATGKDATTCVLTGIAPSVANHAVNFFPRIEDTRIFQLGQSITQEICALFGQGFNTPCSPYVTITVGPTTPFPGSFTSTTTVNLSWHMYVNKFSNIFPFDKSLYFKYNSRFVSGVPSIHQSGGGLCSNSSVPSFSAADYMYLCSPSYDAISSQMEFAPCLTAPGDPSPGSTNNSPGGVCPNTSQLSAVSAGVQTEDAYGRSAFSIPIYDTNDQFGYLSNWQPVINDNGAGIPNSFTWLDAYSPNPTVAGTVRQGFSSNIISLSPYIVSSEHDLYAFRNIYDSLAVQNPSNHRQLIEWMAVSEQNITCTTSTCPGILGYNPPAGTSAAVRLSLRAADLFWQNDASGRHPAERVTSWDVAFSYLSMLGTGAPGSSIASATTGVTIINPSTFDLDLSTLGPFTLISELGLPIIPGQYWSSAGQSAWNSAVDHTVSTCASQPTSSGVLACFRAQYTLSTSATIGASTVPAVACADGTVSSGANGCNHIPASLLNVDTSKITSTFDPVANGILIGSGPWLAVTNGVVGGGTGVTPCGAQVCQTSPSLTLHRYCMGGDCTGPGLGLSGHYFRSNGNLALCVWADQCVSDFIRGFLQFTEIMACYGQPVNLTGPCGHWQQGIGANGGPMSVGILQISIVARFVGTGWVTPYDWQSSPPFVIGLFPPVLYEAGVTLSPASVAGCTQPYPAGGYDC